MSCAVQGLDYEPVFFAEIEPFPCRFLKHKFPGVPNLGDITKINQEDIHDFKQIDMLAGGTPCQGFSVAGQRRGLNDDRSQLALQFSRLLALIRPKWFLWENVPGVFSTNRGADFKRFLEEVTKFGYGIAYRVLDAQYFGVAQRRKRVFVVGYFGDWRPAAGVLFEPKSMSGDSQQDGEIPQDTTRDTTESVAERSYEFDHARDVAKEHVGCPALRVRMGTGGNNIPCVITMSGSYSRDAQFNVNKTGALMAHDGTKGQPPLISYRLCSVHNHTVRKLTERECLRLQGFPDDWLDGVEGYSKTAAYKAIGNSWAVPCARWILRRIEKMEKLLNR